MITARARPTLQDEIVAFHDASWGFFQAILREYPEQSSRISYDGETVEVMTLSTEHERVSSFAQSVVSLIAMELDFPLMSGGSNTLQQSLLKKGLEPDKCFWVAGESAMRGKDRIDLDVDPPPDLVIEVDVAHQVVDREAIYAQLGVPEMWRWKRGTGRFEAFLLVERTWQPTDYSASFPMVRVNDLNPFFTRVKTEGEPAVLRSVQAWLRSLARP